MGGKKSPYRPATNKTVYSQVALSANKVYLLALMIKGEEIFVLGGTHFASVALLALSVY